MKYSLWLLYKYLSTPVHSIRERGYLRDGMNASRGDLGIRIVSPQCKDPNGACTLINSLPYKVWQKLGEICDSQSQSKLSLTDIT